MSKQEGYFEEILGLGIFFVSDSKRVKIGDETELYTKYKFNPPPRRSDEQGPEQSNPPNTSRIETIQLRELRDLSEYIKAIEALEAQEAGIPRSTIAFYQPDSQVGNAVSHRMSTGGQLDPSTGFIYATTRTRATAAFNGFHGAVIVELYNENEQMIGRTLEHHRFGVDGRMIGRNDRTDYWYEHLPPYMTSNVRYTTITHTSAPWDALTTIINFIQNAVEAKKKFNEFAPEFKRLYGATSSLSVMFGSPSLPFSTTARQ
jgi:hypothetical protein